MLTWFQIGRLHWELARKGYIIRMVLPTDEQHAEYVRGWLCDE